LKATNPANVDGTTGKHHRHGAGFHRDDATLRQGVEIFNGLQHPNIPLFARKAQLELLPFVRGGVDGGSPNVASSPATGTSSAQRNLAVPPCNNENADFSES
jgi:hypothetical protein